MRGRARPWELKRPNLRAVCSQMSLWVKKTKAEITAGVGISHKSAGASSKLAGASSSHPAYMQHAETLGRVPAQRSRGDRP